MKTSPFGTLAFIFLFIAAVLGFSFGAWFWGSASPIAPSLSQKTYAATNKDDSNKPERLTEKHQELKQDKPKEDDPVQIDLEKLLSVVEKTQRGWLTIVGLIVSFCGVLLIFVNLSFYFTSKDQISLALNKADEILRQYEHVKETIIKRRLISRIFVSVQKKLTTDSLTKDFTEKNVQMNFLSAFTQILAFIYEEDFKERCKVADDLLKVDSTALRNLITIIGTDHDLAKMYSQDIHYIHTKLHELETAR